MITRLLFVLLTRAVVSAAPLATEVFINEIDANQPGTPDTAEFIELYTPGGARSLAGTCLVLFTGATSTSYRVIDLSPYETNARGFLLIGPPGLFPPADVASPAATDWMRNGQDAIVIYRAAPAAFPNGSTPTLVNAVDAIIYSSSIAASGTITGLGATPVLAESTATPNTSLARRADGQNAWRSQFPTMKATNGPALTYAHVAAAYPTLGASTEDPDRDGMSNATEYLFGGAPFAPEIFPAATMASGITFKKRAAPPAGVSYVLQTSRDLTEWNAEPHIQTALTLQSNGTETVTWLPVTPPAGARTFMRVTATMPTPAPPPVSFPTNPLTPITRNSPFTLTSQTTDYLFVPSSYDGTHKTPMTLFVWLHGCGGMSSGDVWTASLSSSQSWITLAPGGAEGGCWNMSADPARVTAAIANVKTRFNIKPRGVVLGGYSSGGDLAYRMAFYDANAYAGILVANTTPFRDTGSTQAASMAAAAWKFNIVHLAHLQDTTYPIATVRSEISALTAANYPLTLIELVGTHYDNANAVVSGQTVPGTSADIRTRFFPYLDAGWMSP